VGGVAEALTASTFRSDVRPRQCDDLGPYGERSQLKRHHVRISKRCCRICALCIKGDAGLEKPGTGTSRMSQRGQLIFNIYFQIVRGV